MTSAAKRIVAAPAEESSSCVAQRVFPAQSDRQHPRGAVSMICHVTRSIARMRHVASVSFWEKARLTVRRPAIYTRRNRLVGVKRASWPGSCGCPSDVSRRSERLRTPVIRSPLRASLLSRNRISARFTANPLGSHHNASERNRLPDRRRCLFEHDACRGSYHRENAGRTDAEHNRRRVTRSVRSP